MRRPVASLVAAIVLVGVLVLLCVFNVPAFPGTPWWPSPEDPAQREADRRLEDDAQRVRESDEAARRRDEDLFWLLETQRREPRSCTTVRIGTFFTQTSCD